jgi:hypothetical protein
LLSFFFGLPFQRKSVAFRLPRVMDCDGFLFCFLALYYKEKRSSIQAKKGLFEMGKITNNTLLALCE